MRRRHLILAAAIGAALFLSMLLQPSSAQPTPEVLAYVYVDTLGTGGVGWERSNAYLAQPWGLGADGDGVWVANAAGRNLLRFGTGPVQELGKAGSLLDLYGAPARWPVDVVAVGEPPEPLNPTPTATPYARPRPLDEERVNQQSQERAIWFVDQGAHVAVKLPLAADGSPGEATILGETDVPGDDAQHFRGPSGIAVAESGYVFVSDTGNHRVQVFDPSGALASTIGTTGQPGADNGSLNAPARLAVSVNSVLYVADSANHRVQAFDISDPTQPSYVRTFGHTGQAGASNDLLDTPIGLAVDATFVYVADSGNSRVQIIKRTDGRYFRTLDGASREACGQLGQAPWSSVSDVALDRDGHIYVAQPERMQVVSCNAFDRTIRDGLGVPDLPYRAVEDLLNAPSGVVASANGDTIVAELEGHRVVRRTRDGEAVWVVGTAGLAGSGENEFDRPSDVVELADGRLVVADTGNGRLAILGADGAWSGTWGIGVLAAPEGLTVLPDGRLAVADPGTNNVHLFASSGAYGGALTDTSGSEIAFPAPADVVADSRGNFYVSDRVDHTVRVFDAGGSQLRVVGEPGVPGDVFDRLREPHGLALDPDDRLVVADSGNHRVQVFSPDGVYLTTVSGVIGLGTGGMLEPRGVATNADGWLFVSDTYNHRVQIFRPATEPWLPAAVNGFARRSVRAVTELFEFDGRLYAGSSDPDGAGIWRRSASGPWQQVATPAFAGAGHHAILALESFAGELYAGTEQLVVTTNPATGKEDVATRGASLWRSRDGVGWEQVASDGFGDAHNAGIGALAVFDGHLYAGTRGLAYDGEGAQLWRSATGAPGAWERVRIDLFTRTEWVKVGAISALAAYSDTLVAGTCSSNGPHMWSSDNGRIWHPIGYTEDPSDPQAGVPDLGSSGTACVTSFVEHEGYLYAGLGNEDRELRGRFERRGGAEVWRCTRCDGTDWEAVAAPGFGKSQNTGQVALATFVEHPFHYVYAAVGNDYSGLEIWRSIDGLDWQPVVEWGLGDDNNRNVGGGGAIAEYRGRLHVGTANLAHGGEIWSSPGTRPDLVPTPPGPTVTPTPRPSPQPPTGRARYVKAGEWPNVPAAPGDVLGQPVDMAIADDATVYIVDAAPGRLLRLDPDGSWAEPVGGAGSGADRLTEPFAVAVDSAAGRVYASDRGTDRIVVYDREGEYESSILEVHAMDIEVLPDGTFWVADLLVGGVRRLAPDGKELERFGSYGPDEEDQFVNLVAVTQEPGGALWVADALGARLRRFEADAGSYKRVRTLNLGSGQFARRPCSGARMQALSDHLLLAGACILEDGRLRDVLPANHRGSDLYNVGLRTANVSAGLYFALAIYDIDRHDDYNEEFPTVVSYMDEGFDIINDTWRARWLSNETADPNAVADPVRISALVDGSLALSDGFGLRRFTADGTAIEVLPTESVPSRSSMLRLYPNFVVATGEPGRVMGVGAYRYGRGANWEILVYGEGTTRRVCQNRVCRRGIYLDVLWDTTLVNLNQSRGAMDYNYAATFDPTGKQYLLLQLYADNPSDLAMPARVYFFPVEQRGRKTAFVLEGTEREVLWTDIDAGPDGRIYVLDTLGDKVQVLGTDGSDLGQIPTVKDAWKVAGGPNGEVFLLTTYGHVVRMASDGTILSRFVGLPNDFAPHTALMDLAVDEWGRVYTIDTLYDQVTVFEPEGTEDDELQGGHCNLAGDKWAAPTDILLGDTAQVLMRLFGSCGFQEEASDVVLAVGSDWGRNSNLRVARHILSLVDLDTHRAGVISYAADAVIEQPLTYDREALIRSLLAFPYRRPAACGINHVTALKQALKMIDDQPERRKIVILIPPGSEPGRGARCPWDIYRVAEQAALLKAEGAIIVAVNRPSIAASSELLSNVGVAQRGQGVGRPALRRAVSRHWPDNLLDAGTLVDTLPANMDYVAGSAKPAAIWDPAGRTLTWDLTDMKLRDAHGFELTVRPREEGLWPTNVQAVADGTDGWGNPARVVLPIPKVRVYGELPPTPTPTPTATATPTPTVTPGPTRTPGPLLPVYLPIALWTEPCIPDSRNADVVLVVDTSGSMSGTTSPGGPTKLQAAREAARSFVRQLVQGRDQAAVIQFNSEATVVVGLTADLAAAMAGLDQLSQSPETRIDLALDAARMEFNSPARDPDNNPVIILLTDGAPTGTTPADVRAAARRVHDAGYLLFTIGLGQDVDGDLLRQVATKPEWYFYAPDTSDLIGIYDQIVYEIPCQPMWP